MRYRDNIEDTFIFGGLCDMDKLDSRYTIIQNNETPTTLTIDIFDGSDDQNIFDFESIDTDNNNQGNSYMNVFGNNDNDSDDEVDYIENLNNDLNNALNYSKHNLDNLDNLDNLNETQNNKLNDINKSYDSQNNISGGAITEIKSNDNVINELSDINDKTAIGTLIQARTTGVLDIFDHAEENKCNDCADYKSNVCAPQAVINIIKEELNLSGNNDDVIKQAKQMMKCDAEACVINKDKIKNRLKKINIDVKHVLDKYYKPDGPRNNTQLISNVDIGKLFKKWEDIFPNFSWVEFTMLDYQKANDEFSKVTIDKLLKNNKNCFGTIINTDSYIGGSGGIHWMALFIDMRNPIWTVEFFNSTGDTNNKIKTLQKYQQTDIWQKNMIKQMIKYKNADEIYLAKILHKHQKKNSECGVYSLFYIWSRLNGVPFIEFTTHDIPDDDMTKFRKFLFRS